MTFVKPMLASPLPSTLEEGVWVAEEKYDGHRLCVNVDAGEVVAYARSGIVRELPGHVARDLAQLPDGIYDGELISTARTKSYGVTELVQADKLQVVLFDVIRVVNQDCTALTYRDRRALLEEIFGSVPFGKGVSLSKMYAVRSLEDARALALAVWRRGGEGLILKRTTSTYASGKRSRSWLKIKQAHTAALTVKGFVAGLLGPHAIVLLEDEDGNQVSVKTLNTKERIRIGSAPECFVGQKLRIEYQERTPDGGYRHPMWDRWETE